jgi:aspartate/glutamate racemase
MKKIGVLGGMGPEATILFQQRLLNAVRGMIKIISLC